MIATLRGHSKSKPSAEHRQGPVAIIVDHLDIVGTPTPINPDEWKPIAEDWAVALLGVQNMAA